MKYDVLVLILDNTSSLVQDGAAFYSILQQFTAPDSTVLLVSANRSLNLVEAGVEAGNFGRIPPLPVTSSRYGQNELRNWITQAELNREGDGKAVGATGVLADFNIQLYPGLLPGLGQMPRPAVLPVQNAFAIPASAPKPTTPYPFSQAEPPSSDVQGTWAGMVALAAHKQEKSRHPAAVVPHAFKSFFLKWVLPALIGGGIGLFLFRKLQQVRLPVIDLPRLLMLLSLAFLVVGGTIHLMVSWERHSRLGHRLRLLAVFCLLAALLRASYFPNIVARPLNLVGRLVTGGSLLREYVYHQRGLLGMYRTTGTVSVTAREWVYIGGIVRNRLVGQGRVFWRDGTVFEGQYRDDQRNGPGCFTYPDGGTLECNFTDGMANGPGRRTFSDGQVEEGNYYNGNPHGVFVVTTPEGQVFEMEFVHGEANRSGP